jgi:ribosomal protein S18 acetylase RimI-like enzyme
VDLDNIIWRALSGSQSRLSAGTDRIRRFARGYPAMIGYANPDEPGLDVLAPYCEAGETFYCAQWQGPEPAGWRVQVDTTMSAMLWSGPAPSVDASVQTIRLGHEHVSQMCALAEATRPGPFAALPLELGEWHGVVEDGRLVAMAGERLHAAPLHEVSGICTLPEFEGRGLGRHLTAIIVRAQLARGETPFLHVASSNARARKLYERMGFAVEREVALRVISRVG